MTSWLGGTFAALSHRDFRVIWTGSLLAFVAFFMSTAVQGVVAFDLSGSNEAVGFVIFAQGVAQLALGPFGGALADRVSRRLLIFICQAAITSCFFVLGVLVVTDTITIASLAAASFIIGSAFSFLGPARQGMMVDFVGPRHRGNAIALSQVALNASRIAGPMFAAAFLATDVIGAAGAFFGMGALYLGTLATTWMLPGTAATSTGTGRSVLAEIWTGIRYVAHTPSIRGLVPSYILIIMCGFPYVSVLPGLVKNELHRDASQITILLMINAVGGLAASLAVASLADSRRAPMVYTGMCLTFGLALLASGVAPGFWVLAATMLFVGAGAGGFQTLNGALVSHFTEPAYFGRVISLTFLAFAVSSIVALPVGQLADGIGERHTIALSGGAVCLIVVAYQVGPLLARAFRGQPAEATGGGIHGP